MRSRFGREQEQALWRIRGLAPLAYGMHGPPAGGWLRRVRAATIRNRVTRGTDHSRHLRHESAGFGRRFPDG